MRASGKPGPVHFVFLQDREVPPTNNVSEREIRPSVIFRKVTGGFRSDWGARIHAGYRSITGTARLHGKTALEAIDQLLIAASEPAPANLKSLGGEQLPSNTIRVLRSA